MTVSLKTAASRGRRGVFFGYAACGCGLLGPVPLTGNLRLWGEEGNNTHHNARTGKLKSPLRKEAEESRVSPPPPLNNPASPRENPLAFQGPCCCPSVSHVCGDPKLSSWAGSRRLTVSAPLKHKTIARTSADRRLKPVVDSNSSPLGGGREKTPLFMVFFQQQRWGQIPFIVSLIFFVETRGKSPAEAERGGWAKPSAGRYLGLLPALQINLLIAAARAGWVSVLN